MLIETIKNVRVIVVSMGMTIVKDHIKWNVKNPVADTFMVPTVLTFFNVVARIVKEECQALSSDKK